MAAAKGWNACPIILMSRVQVQTLTKVLNFFFKQFEFFGDWRADENDIILTLSVFGFGGTTLARIIYSLPCGSEVAFTCPISRCVFKFGRLILALKLILTQHVYVIPNML
jgi:hypothetical protein